MSIPKDRIIRTVERFSFRKSVTAWAGQVYDALTQDYDLRDLRVSDQAFTEKIAGEAERALKRELTPKQSYRQSIALLRAVELQNAEEKQFWQDQGAEIFDCVIERMFDRHQGDAEKVKADLRELSSLIKQFDLQTIVNQAYAKCRSKF